MAEVFAPFPIQRTMCNLTFYMIEGRNFVRTKSSLTRRKVLYSAQFKNTRHFAGLMAKASKIGSQVYNALPEYWRQGWMYRSFTGEAYTMLKIGKKEEEIQKELYKRYVEELIGRQPKGEITIPSIEPPKRRYRKQNSEYWKNKSLKSKRRKARKEQTMYYASLMAQASRIGSKLYRQLPCRYTGGGQYQYLTGLALKLLKQEVSEEDIIAGLLATLPGASGLDKARARKKAENVVKHQNGQYYFVPAFNKRFSIYTGPFPKVPQRWNRVNFVRSG